MNTTGQSQVCVWAFTLLRTAIGWHFLYEGVIKILAKDWTSAPYLANSTWVLSDVFHRIAESPGLLRIVDLLNMWGLTLIGLSLLLGILTRVSASLGVVLLLLYYAAISPAIGLSGSAGEGSYLFVNKNLIEAFALLVIALLPRTWMYGFDQLLAIFMARRTEALVRSTAGSTDNGASPENYQTAHRRELLKQLVGVPTLGAFCFGVSKKRKWDSLEEKYLLDPAVDGTTSATLKTFHFSKLQDLQGTMIYKQIGPLKVSQVILGGNLIGGWAHARDLIYVSNLIKAYHDDERVIATFKLAEKCGINTFLTHPKLLRIIRKYWHLHGGQLQYIADCGGNDLHGAVRLAIEGGAHACYVQGATADRLVSLGKNDEIRRFLDTVRSHGLPAGIGAHNITTVKACIHKNIRPDFWMKTLHHHNYWSAGQNSRQHDNALYSIFCSDPEETIAVMKTVPEPWIAFKVLAAGAIRPEDGFAYAFNNGADFICVGMYDFQIVDDVNIAAEILANLA